MNKLKDFIKLIFHGHYEMNTPEGRSRERARNIALTAITAMLAKIIAMATPLITVRLTLSYMGEEIYGLWSAVTSFFVMFTFADLGLGSGLHTELGKATALDDEMYCRKIVSSTYVILSGVAIGLVFLFAVLYPNVNWAHVVNADSEAAGALVSSVVLAIVIPKLCNIPIALIQRTQMAMQEGYRSNLWQCSGNLLSLGCVIIIYYMDLGVLTMIWASSAITVFVSLVNMLAYFGYQRPNLRPSIKYFDVNITRKLLSTGIAFFILSIFTSISLSIDNFIVAHACGLADVTPYSVMYKIVSMISVATAMLSSPMWSANGEAMQRGEYGWVNRATKKIASMSTLFAMASSLIIFVLIKPVLYILTDNMVQADLILLAGMCLLQIITSLTSPYFMILNGAGIVKFQIVTYAIYAVISLPLKYALGQQFGVMAITWVGAISYVFLLAVPVIWKGKRYLRKKQM